MKTVDEERLERDLAYRFEYVAGFVGFGPADQQAILASAPWLAPHVDGLVDAVYVKLFEQDATKRHFAVAQAGYDGPLPASLAELTLDHPVIAFRKSHLADYLVRLVSGPYDAGMVRYLDRVGQIHTAQAGSRQVRVPLVQMVALLGFVHDALLATLFALKLDTATTERTARAFTKLLWLQLDLIARHPR